MAIETGAGDLARATTHEADESWPETVKIVLGWPNGAVLSLTVEADQFFGRGAYGAPLSGDWLIGAIDRMRRQGAPTVHASGVRKGRTR